MTNKNRKASLTISDLETIQALEQIRLITINSEKYNEHNEIFEEICQDAEAEDELMESSLTSSTIMTRRTSITSCTTTTSSSSSSFTIVVEPNDVASRRKDRRYPRRHSTYNGRNRKFHRDAHATIKDYLLTIQDVNHARRTSFVTNLMDFNLSYEVAMAASTSNEISPTLNLSCPILSYLKEDDEDSIELVMIKRPSLIADKEEFNQSANWESLKDDGESEEEESMDSPRHKTEYVVELAPLEDDEEDYDSSWGKKHKNTNRRKKKVHSYQMLEQRLSSESHMSVVKSFGFHGMTTAIGYPTTTTSHTLADMKFSSSQQRRLSDDNPATKEYTEEEESQNVSSAYPTRNHPISTKQPCARGA